MNPSSSLIATRSDGGDGFSSGSLVRGYHRHANNSDDDSDSECSSLLLYYYDEDGKLDHDPFIEIPFEQIADVLSFVSLPDRNHFARTCRQQRRLRDDGIDGTVAFLSEPDGHGLGGLFRSNVGASPYWLEDVEALRQSRTMQLSRLVGLVSLNIGHLGTNEFLRLLSGGGTGQDDGEHLLPNLEVLSMVDSRGITDEGILALGNKTEGLNGKRRTNLRELDVTFCSQVSYGAILALRKLLSNPLLVRRQPKWLDGHFETPFSGRQPIEVHTYYPDGSFSFGRSEQSAGYVSTLFKWANAEDNVNDDDNSDECHLGDKLQYIDFNPANWPNWTRFAYRPGVSLLRVPDEMEGNESIIRSVLVAQNRKGFRPPANFPNIGHLDKVPLGESRFFCEEGDMLPGYDEEENIQVVMISRMKVRPLSENEMIPPAELTDRIDEFVAEMESTDVPINGEEVVHAVLGGLGLDE